MNLNKFFILQEKRAGNKCDGSCAGIQYFHCLPGFGIFTTIEKIIPKEVGYESDDEATMITNLDIELQKNMLSLEPTKRDRENVADKQKQLSDGKTTFKTSVSLQNINDPVSVNMNNDFDQNSILQPDNLQLLKKQLKPVEKKMNKREVDLIESIGGFWSGSTEQDKLPSYTNLKKALNIDNNIHSNTTDRHTSYRTTLTKNFSNGSKTLPKKSKLLSKESHSPTSKSKFFIGK